MDFGTRAAHRFSDLCRNHCYALLTWLLHISVEHANGCDAGNEPKSFPLRLLQRLQRALQPYPPMLPPEPPPEDLDAVDITRSIVFVARTPRTIGPYTEVYIQQHKNLGDVAVKRIRYDMDDDEQPRALKKECARLLRVHHDHLLPVLGICEHDGICVVTQWQVNGDVVAYLSKHPDSNRLILLTQVADALTYLHRLGLVHGNIHPRNVLISATGSALLTEYCLIEHVPDENGGSMRPSHLRDKVMFVAPEINSGSPRSQSTDVFAFGMLVFYAYCERPPMPSRPGAIQAVAALMKGERPTRAEVKREGFTDALWNISTRCWDHNPGHRPYIYDVHQQLTQLK